MPKRATKLFQLRDFCVGGAVLRYRRVGCATLRGSAERAINRGAARNMMLERTEENEEKKVGRVQRKRSCCVVTSKVRVALDF
jgi:hypothetical protein